MSYTELEHGYQGLRKATRPTQFYVGGGGDLELCNANDPGPSDMEDGKQVVVGVCAMAKKSQSKPMKEILTRLQEFEYIKMLVFPEEVILKKSVEEWPMCDCLISFHSKGFPLDKAIQYAQLHHPYVINNLHMQYDIQDRRRVYAILEAEGIEIPRYAVLDRDSPDPKHHELVESEDHVEVNGVTFNKPFVEKPVSAEDHNIYIYYPTSAGGGSQRLFRKIGSRSSVYSPESRVRKTGSFIYEDFMPTDGTDVKVYTVGPDYAHAEARKSPALDGKVERDSEGKEIRYPVILSNAEKLISRKVCLAFKQAVCGFDLLRANGKSFVCDVNGFSFVKNSNKYYDDCAKILGNMILRELAPTLHIPWSVPFQLDDPPIVPTTFGKMMELRCVVAVIRHGDRTPKQKMKVEVRHPKFFEIFEKYDGYKQGHVKLKRPKQLQEILDIARSLLAEIQQREADPEIEEKQGKLEQLKSVLEMYGHFSGINRKVQMKYQPRGRPRGSSSDDGKTRSTDAPAEPSLVLILKWGGELTPAGRIQAEELGRIFRCMYPGGQGRHLAGEYAGTQGLGLLRLHSTFRHDLKIYASDEGRVQMTAAAFAKGLLALEGELTPILVQMVKSANTNGLLDNDCDSSKYQNMCKSRLHELMQIDREFTAEERDKINPGHALSIDAALDFVKNPVRCCQHVHELIKSLMEIVKLKKDDVKTKDAILYHGETWELMGRRWGKIEKDFFTKNKKFDISKIPDIYDCIKYDLQHNQHTLQFEQAEELYIYAKYLADIVIPQEYGLTAQEKLTIGQGICTPLLKKIRADLQRNIEECGEEEETVNRLNPRYSHGVSSPGRHVRTRLYFTSESHVHSLLTVLRHGGLLDIGRDEQWRRAMEYVSMVSELNYMSQVVVMLYEDPTKDPCSEERFHVELHFSPGVNCCVQKNLPPGPGFRPHSRNESVASKSASGDTSLTATPDDSQCSARIDEETEVGQEPSTVIVGVESPPLSPLHDHQHDRQYLKASDPIPIGSAHTVSGHEAMDLAKKLSEELANQAQSYGYQRAVSPDTEPRARSYDHHSPQTKAKSDHMQYQSLDAVNNQDTVDRTTNNTLVSPPIHIPNHTSSISIISPSFEDAEGRYNPEMTLRNYSIANICTISHKPCLTPILGSLDKGDSFADISAKIEKELNLNKPYSHSHAMDKPENKYRSSSLMATNELPLTELNLDLFTSERDYDYLKSESRASSTNELPLSDIKLKPDDTLSDTREYEKPVLPTRSFSDPNILDLNERTPIRKSDNDNRQENSSYFPPLDTPCFEQPCEPLARAIYNVKSYSHHYRLSPVETPLYPYSFYPTEYNTHKHLLNAPPSRSASQPAQLSLNANTVLNPLPVPPLRSLSNPDDLSPHISPLKRAPSPPIVMTQTPVNPEASSGVKRHRHSIAGQMSYIKMLGFGFGGPIGLKKMTGGSSNSLFSTAVISGSSSAPNLRDMIPSTASATAIEGIGGVPPIRPLETLHNALSLRQLDTFLEKMVSAPLFRTPASSPPKYPSTPLPTPTGSTAQTSATGLQQATSSHPPPLRLQSPSNSFGWSGPPSFVSSSGPSSPNGLSDPYSRESSSLSASIISSDGAMNAGAISQMFPTAPGLDQDLGNVGILLETERNNVEDMEFAEFYSPTTGKLHTRGDSGDITPVSGGSEIDFNTTDATAGSTADADVTMTEDFENSEDDILNATTPLPESLLAQKSLAPEEFAFKKPTDSNLHTNTKQKTGNKTIHTEDCLSKSRYTRDKPVLKRLSSLNLSEPSNIPLYVSEAKGLHVCSNILNTSLQNTKLLKHVDNAERFHNKPSVSTHTFEDNFIFSKYRTNNEALTKSGLFDKDIKESSKNISVLGSDKWCTSKEKFLDTEKLFEGNYAVTKPNLEKDATDVSKNLLQQTDEKIKCEKTISKDLQVPKVSIGAVLVKESFIEPPRMTRISKSFHGKTSSNSNLNIASIPRRASDSVPSLCNNMHEEAPETLKNIFPTSKAPKSPRRCSEASCQKSVNIERQFVTQLSQPCASTSSSYNTSRKASLNIDALPIKTRFTTTLVDEAEFAASHSASTEVRVTDDNAGSSSIAQGFGVDKS